MSVQEAIDIRDIAITNELEADNSIGCYSQMKATKHNDDNIFSHELLIKIIE